jgi:eukaryotic-like serine/threonine-protein kinase
MAEDSRIALLLDELFDNGLTPEEACRDHPQLLQEVDRQWQRMIALKARLDARFPAGSMQVEKDSQVPAPSVGLPQIAGYEVESVLGEGGMGIVYKARHLKLNRAVAIKMLRSGTYAGPHELARFQREAKSVAGLRHANIVQVYDVGDVEGRPYYTMEFVEGGNLAQRIAGQPQPGLQASEIVTALAEAMQAAHRHGIIHRDLKPANILLSSDGTPKISDFGLARHFETDERLTLSGARIGTLSYMAPEQALGKPGSIGPAVDIYSLGAVLYEMIVGRPPFRAETDRETERQLLTEEPVPPRRLNAAVPRDLDTICLKCLQKNPQRRYESAGDLAADLHRFERGEIIAARPVSLFERAGRWARRRPAVVAALSLGFVMIMAALGGVSWLVAERQTNRHAIKLDLRDAARLQRVSNWSEARTALERARGRLGVLGFSDLKASLEQADRDQEVAAHLDKVRANRTTTMDGRIDSARCIAEYEAVFRDSKVGDRGDDPALFANRIGRSNIQAILVSAIEDWAAITEDDASLNWLLQVARQAAPDPTGWRRRALSLAVWNKRSDLAELIASAPVTENSIPLLLALGERYRRQGGNPVDLFAKCQKVRSSDFWANFSLAKALRAQKNPTESIRYFQAALAIRPDSADAHNQLGLALTDLMRFDDAMEMFQAAMTIDPVGRSAGINLSMLLSFADRHAEAIPKLRESISLKPGEALLYSCLGDSLSAVGQREEAWENFKHAIELDPAIIFKSNRTRLQFIRQERGDEVLALWRIALAAGPPEHDFWDGYAELSLFLGRENEYRWARSELLKRFGGASDPPIAERVARACLLLPGTEEELRQASVLVGRAMAADRSKYGTWIDTYFSFAQGLLAYRQGRFDESSRVMQGSVAGVLGPAPALVLAIDQFHLGEEAEAGRTLEKALKIFDWQPAKAESREAWIYHILRREAEALIKRGS